MDRIKRGLVNAFTLGTPESIAVGGITGLIAYAYTWHRLQKACPDPNLDQVFMVVGIGTPLVIQATAMLGPYWIPIAGAMYGLWKVLDRVLV